MCITSTSNYLHLNEAQCQTCKHKHCQQQSKFTSEGQNCGRGSRGRHQKRQKRSGAARASLNMPLVSFFQQTKKKEAWGTLDDWELESPRSKSCWKAKAWGPRQALTTCCGTWCQSMFAQFEESSHTLMSGVPHQELTELL